LVELTHSADLVDLDADPDLAAFLDGKIEKRPVAPGENPN